MRLVFFLLIFILFSKLQAQEKYWVYLSDKEGVSFDPATYFDQKALDRRKKLNIPLDHVTDRPIKKSYFAKINSIADTICGHTRWFNALACILTEEQLSEVQMLPFVTTVEAMNSTQQLAGSIHDKLHQGEQDLLKGQLSWMRGNEFTKNGFTGKGLRICIIDAGFPRVNESEVFKHIRDSNRIIKTWDFKKNKPDVYKFNSHGSTVLSCIAGIVEGENIGLATDAEFLLARTERILYEGLAEEEAWLMAIEWADKNGADMVNSSLGYTTARHFKEDMDGKTCIISRAGNLAAKKGMLVINAAGNDGDGYWKYIGAPADADSVLSVGGVNPWTGLHTSFSSYGPTSDHRLKPNVSAFGHVMGFGSLLGMHETQGTSFSCPLVTGFAACAWQADTTLTAMELFKKIEQSSYYYPYYDYAHGYGIPQATYFIPNEEAIDTTSTFRIEENDIEVNIIINDEHFSIEDQIKLNYYPMVFNQLKYINWIHLADIFGTSDSNIKRKRPEYFYYHSENDAGYLDEYFTLSVLKKEILSIPKIGNEGKIFRFHYKGTTKQITL